MDRIDKDKLVDSQIGDLCKNFDTYLDKFNTAPLYDDTLSQHKEMLELRDKLGGVANSIVSDEYLSDLRSMLVAWGVDSRRAELEKYDKFAKSVRKCKDDIVSLEGKGVAQINADIADELWQIIKRMKLSNTGSQTVTGAKALHHLLPQLMPPIDGRHTGTFFRYYHSQLQNEKNFSRMLSCFARIANEVKVELGIYVEKTPWATSESKVIDNAIIGYCRLHIGLMIKYASISTNDMEYAVAHISRCQLCKDVVFS